MVAPGRKVGAKPRKLIVRGLPLAVGITIAALSVALAGCGTSPSASPPAKTSPKHICPKITPCIPGLTTSGGISWVTSMGHRGRNSVSKRHYSSCSTFTCPARSRLFLWTAWMSHFRTSPESASCTTFHISNRACPLFGSRPRGSTRGWGAARIRADSKGSIHVQSSMPHAVLQLQLNSRKRALLEGGGLDPMGRHGSSYYYSLTDLGVQGRIRYHGHWVPVRRACLAGPPVGQLGLANYPWLDLGSPPIG